MCIIDHDMTTALRTVQRSVWHARHHIPLPAACSGLAVSWPTVRSMFASKMVPQSAAAVATTADQAWCPPVLVRQQVTFL